MAKRKISTVGEMLHWSYANLAMMANLVEDGLARPNKTHYMIRSKLYSGLRKGTMHVRGFFDDEKLKLKLPSVCWYCGSSENLSVDHVVPQSKGGSHGGENLIYSCRPCNSSKGSTDLLAWMEKRKQFPCLYLLRRYLKMAIEYCVEHELMEMTLPVKPDLLSEIPFALDRVPQKYPPATELFKFVTPKTTKS